MEAGLGESMARVQKSSAPDFHLHLVTWAGFLEEKGHMDP